MAATGWTQGVRNGLEVVELATPASTCTIALHGAHVLSFAPRGDRDWLWVSEKADFDVGKPLRGGIPICFPWFGPHSSNRDFPQHGFARTRVWHLTRVAEIDGNRLRAELELGPDPATARLFPHAFAARLAVTAGEELELAFEVANAGDAAFAYEVALHTYFGVSAVGAIAIEGLGGRTYIDRVAGGARGAGRRADPPRGRGGSGLRKQRTRDDRGPGPRSTDPRARHRRAIDGRLEPGRDQGPHGRRHVARGLPSIRLRRDRQRP